ncbi:MAG: hypothetical protein N2C14_12280, partial [Planctomycetales bacterium]
PTSGQYALEVRDLHRGGGPLYVYRLRVEESRPDFSLAVTADHFAVTPEKPLEIPVTVTRSGGMSGEINISVTDLPDGVSAATVTSMGKGETAKSVKLIIQAKTAAAGKTIRVVGIAKHDGLTVSREATAPVVGLSQQTQYLWLSATVPPKKK